MTQAIAASEAESADIVPKRKHRYIIVLLTAIYALAFVDRQIMNILAEPIKNDLGLADWQVGAMSGLVFAIFYTAAIVPMARLAETKNRVYVLSGVLTLWSGFTALSGFATSFLHLIIARLGVGIGEAGCVPSAHSLIADITPRKKRAAALATFSMGLPIGSLVGLALGGIIEHYFDWRTAFLVVGLPGLLLAALMVLTVRDPRSKKAVASLQASQSKEAQSKEAQSPDTPKDKADVPTFRQTLRDLWSKPSFAWMTIGATILAFAGYGHATFFASFFLRNHQAELDVMAGFFGLGGGLAFLGVALGLALGISGTLGTAIGGRLGDRFAASSFKGYMHVPLIGTVCGVPLFVIALLVPSAWLALLLIAFASLFKSMWFGPVFATIQGLVDPRSRATAVSIFLLIMNGVGLGLGPLCLGALSDVLTQFFDPSTALRGAMVATAVIMLGAAFCFIMARRSTPHTALS